MTGLRDRDRSRDFERFIGRLLIVVTYIAVALLSVGVALMIAAGISPLAGGPPLDLRHLVAELMALGPAAYLWLGILAVIATPISRVVASVIGFARIGDRWMVAVAVAILTVMAIGVASALAAA